MIINKKRIGLLSFDGKLGYSIRVDAFRHALEESGKFDLTVINASELMDDLAPSYQNMASCLMRYGWTNLWKREVCVRLAAKRLDRKIIDGKIDVIQAETPLSAHIWLRSNQICPCILDMHGLFYEEMILRGRLKGFTDKIYWKTIQNDIIKAADFVFFVSTAMERYYKKIHSNIHSIVLPNGAYISNKSAKYSSEFKIAYAGIFEYWENAPDFISLAKYCLGQLPVEFLLIGGGRLENEVLRNCPKNVKYLGRLERSETISALLHCQVGVAPSSTDITRQVACPIKVFEYMSIGLPVLTVDIGEWSQIVKEEICGVVINENTPERYFEGLGKMMDQDKWELFSGNGKRVIKEKYNWLSLITNIAFPIYENI